MDLKVILLLLYSLIILNVECAKILGIFQFPSKSHHIAGSSLLKALAKRGHEVTMISPFPLKTPLKNYEDIELTGMLEYKEENMVRKFLELGNASWTEKISVIMDMMNKVDERFLTHPSLRTLLASNRKFDVVIQNYMGNDVYMALPYFFEASTIAFSLPGVSFVVNELTGNSAPPSYVPNLFPPFPSEMTFLQRVGNTLCVVGSQLYYHLYVAPQQEHLRQKYFPKAPPLTELLLNVSLVLANSHFSIESPRPYLPSMIQVGGLHIEEPKDLKGDIREFMDSAVGGVIFFSLGSNVRSSDLPQSKLDVIVSTFAKLPLKVLWKFEKDNVPNLSPNVKIEKWLPQTDILAHPNIKLFVTHGGLLSTIEAVYHGVPMVGIPIFADQEGNVDDGVFKGYVIKVPFEELSEQKLTNAINEGLSNPKYRKNVKQRASVLKDQPLKPLDTAVFWVEYVIRHKGAHHLKISGLKLRWYQYYLLDIIAFLAAVTALVFAIVYFTLRALFRLCKKMFSQKDKDVSAKSSVQVKKTKLA